MRITELLQDATIDLGVKVNSKEEAIDHLVDLMVKGGNITDREEYKKGILAREANGTTGIGGGIAIPHSKNKAVTKAGLASMTVPDGVDYEAMDGEPSDVFFMIAAPAEGSDVHLEALSRLSVILMDPVFKDSLLKATSKEEYLALIDKKETEKFPEEAAKEEEEPAVQEEKADDGTIRVLAVTACPTGIAHTFMAAESLENKAKEMGITLKAETNGSGGAKNVLTKEEIENCDGIIVAADKNVEMARFDGKQVLQTKVADGINKPEELIQTILDKKAPTYHHSGAAAQEDSTEGESVGRQIYKHLMNGVSHMLPFVVAGGVLTAISFLWGIYSFDPTSDQYNVIAATIKTVGGTSMGLMVPIFAAFIAQSIGDRPGMIAGFVGGTIASTTGSGFIGGIIAGFFAGYLCKFVVGALKGLPRQFEGLKSIFFIPIITVAIVGIVMQVTAGPVAAINNGMMNFLAGLQNSNPVILGLAVGCMSAFDMGGPVNKAAYVTGTTLLASGNYYFMAGVSAACITPPLIIAIAATISKKKFSKADRAAAYVNYILGCTHITEGAIPFAAKDPVRVLPILMVGSSISAIATYIMKVQVPAPHGGFLILPLVHPAITWVLCILAGSVVGAILYVLTAKDVEE